MTVQSDKQERLKQLPIRSNFSSNFKQRLKLQEDKKEVDEQETEIEEVVEEAGVFVKDERLFETAIRVRQDNYPLLYEYAHLMNKKEVTVLNREDELSAMYASLHRLMMPNVALLGPAGVGKSALVESYATLHADEGVLIFEVNLVLMMDKGDEVFGERMKRLITEVDNLVKERESLGEIDPRTGKALDVILFFDEMHLLTQAAVDRGAIGSIASNAIKPALARGLIKVIGATTDNEYDKYIKCDDAFHTRFQGLRLNEPDNETVVSILKALVEHFSESENFPFNTMTDESVYHEIVEYTNRYVQASAQPRKSISILDGALGVALAYKEPINHALIKRIFEEKFRVDVDWRSDIDAVLQTIRDGLIGQDLAIKMLSNRLFTANVGLQDKGRPLANFLFAGSTGVGKAIWDDELVPYLNDGHLDYKRHGDLKVGDYVFNANGLPTKVLAVFPQGEINAYMLHTNNGFVVGNDEHLFKVFDSLNGHYEILTIAQLYTHQKEMGGSFFDRFKIPLGGCMQYGRGYPLDIRQLAKDFCFDDVFQLSVENEEALMTLLFEGSILMRFTFIKEVLELRGRLVGRELSESVIYEDVNIWKLSMFERIFKTLGIPYSIKDNVLSFSTLYAPFALFNFGVPISSSDLEELVMMPSGMLDVLYIENLETTLPMSCIMVSDPSHLYMVTENHLVTHNTEMSKLIAKGIFGSEESMIRFDMSEFNRESDANIFQMRLADAVERKPYSLILLDEFEKSSRPVKNLMLGVMDDGRLTDRYGRQIAFNNCIIVITTNAGHHAFKEIKRMDMTLEESDTYIRNELKKEFPAEFLGRFDEVVPFAPLTAEGFEEIAKIQVTRLMQKVKSLYDIDLIFDRRVPIYLVYQRFDAERDTTSGGGRAMKRRIEREVVPLIARVIEKCRLQNRSRPTIIRIIVEGELVHEHKDLVHSNAYLAAEFELEDLTLGYLSEHEPNPKFTEYVPYSNESG